MVLSTFSSSPLDWLAKASTILTAAMFRICILNQVYTVLNTSAGAKAALPRGRARSGRASKGKDCAPSGRGWWGQRLRSLGEGPVGAKAALPQEGACEGKGYLYLEEAKLASESNVQNFFHLNIVILLITWY